MPAPLGHPVAADASLHLLADHLAEALAGEAIEPCVLHVGGVDGDGFELGVRPLAGAHPTDVLLGMEAPADWHAVGLATHGWAYHVADRARADRRRHRVHIVTLLSRTGEHAHRARTDDAELQQALTDERPAGEQVDLLHRALRLPTAPPPCDASAYWSIQWLTSLVGADGSRPVSTVRAAMRAHPAMRLIGHDVQPTDADVEDVVAAFHRVVSWPRMRALAAEDRFTVPELLPEDAGWLDDGAFARFVLNRCTPLHVLRARLAVHVPADVADAVLELLDQLGVPERTWPDATEPPRPAA